MAAFYEEEDFDAEEITRADIDACKDPAQLREWMRSLDGREQSIKANIDSRIEVGTSTDAFLYRASQALAYTKIGKSAVKRRMRELGCDESHTTEIQRLIREVALAKAHAAYAKHFVQAAKTMLPSETLAKVGAAAAAALGDVEMAA